MSSQNTYNFTEIEELNLAETLHKYILALVIWDDLRAEARSFAMNCIDQIIERNILTSSTKSKVIRIKNIIFRNSLSSSFRQSENHDLTMIAALSIAIFAPIYGEELLGKEFLNSVNYLAIQIILTNDSFSDLHNDIIIIAKDLQDLMKNEIIERPRFSNLTRVSGRLALSLINPITISWQGVTEQTGYYPLIYKEDLHDRDFSFDVIIVKGKEIRFKINDDLFIVTVK